MHWIAALSFLYVALTGLALWTTQLFWLSHIFGGGEATRRWHPWGGRIFAFVLAVIVRKWFEDMKLNHDDRIWIKKLQKYVTHDDEDLPEPGRFNAGQKMLFWIQSFSTILLLVSGIILWFPEHVSLSNSFRIAAILIHSSTAVISISSILIHIYMGTVAVPGALESMLNGKVSRGWARMHHPNWYRDVTKK